MDSFRAHIATVIIQLGVSSRKQDILTKLIVWAYKQGAADAAKQYRRTLPKPGNEISDK